MVGIVILGTVLVAAIVMVAVGASRERAVNDDERIRNLRDWAAEHRWSFAEGDLKVPWRGRVGHDGFQVSELLTGHVGGLPVSLGHGTYPLRRVVTEPDGGRRTETVTSPLTVLVIESGAPDTVRDRLSSDLIRARLDDEPPLWNLSKGELMVVLHTPLLPSDLDEHLGTARRLAEMLGHRY